MPTCTSANRPSSSPVTRHPGDSEEEEEGGGEVLEFKWRPIGWFTDRIQTHDQEKFGIAAGSHKFLTLLEALAVSVADAMPRAGKEQATVEVGGRRRDGHSLSSQARMVRKSANQGPSSLTSHPLRSQQVRGHDEGQRKTQPRHSTRKHVFNRVVKVRLQNSQ